MLENNDKQFELIDKILMTFDKADILKHIMFVGSWCIYFYRHCFKNFSLDPIRTTDIDINVNQLSKAGLPVNIPSLLKPYDFEIKFAKEGDVLPYADPEKERAYQREYKRQMRAANQAGKIDEGKPKFSPATAFKKRNSAFRIRTTAEVAELLERVTEKLVSLKPQNTQEFFQQVKLIGYMLSLSLKAIETGAALQDTGGDRLNVVIDYGESIDEKLNKLTVDELRNIAKLA